MGAPTIATGTTANGTAFFATLQPLTAAGTASKGVVSNLAVTLSDVGVTAATAKTSASDVPYVEFDPAAVGTAVATFTSTVTDPVGTVSNLTVTANVVVTAAATDVLTASLSVLFSATVPA